MENVLNMGELKFRNLKNVVIEDITTYLNEKISEDTKVLIGCDSQNTGRKTIYGLVIVLHYGNRGGHVLYTKLEYPIIKDRFSKLWKEVELSLGLAEMLKDNGLKRVDYIDLDLNPDPKYNSNSILRSALGWCQSMGYNVRHKPEAVCSSYVADRICRNVRYRIKKNKKVKVSERHSI